MARGTCENIKASDAEEIKQRRFACARHGKELASLINAAIMKRKRRVRNKKVEGRTSEKRKGRRKRRSESFAISHSLVSRQARMRREEEEEVDKEDEGRQEG